MLSTIVVALRGKRLGRPAPRQRPVRTGNQVIGELEVDGVAVVEIKTLDASVDYVHAHRPRDSTAGMTRQITDGLVSLEGRRSLASTYVGGDGEEHNGLTLVMASHSVVVASMACRTELSLRTRRWPIVTVTVGTVAK